MAFKEAIKQHYENIVTAEKSLSNLVRFMSLCVSDEIKQNPKARDMWDEETNTIIRNVMAKYPNLWNPEAFKRRG